MAAVPKDDAIVYRTEVLAIIGALAHLVVDVRAIREWLEGDDEAEEDQERS
jgi:3-mercaptopyruvate sulfurtransferase SseA